MPKSLPKKLDQRAEIKFAKTFAEEIKPILKVDLAKLEISQTKPSRFKEPAKLTKNKAEEKNLRQSDLTKKYAE